MNEIKNYILKMDLARIKYDLYNWIVAVSRSIVKMKTE